MNSEFLNDILECSVCLKPLDDQNKVLPCQHTFCKSCLQSIVKSHKELRCPECRVLVRQRVDDLPSNILLIRLLDGIKCQQNQIQKNAEKIETRRHSVEGILSEPVPASGGAKDGGIIPNPMGDAVRPISLHERTASESASTKLKAATLRPHARAIFTYESDQPSDLKFEEGDTIQLLKKIDSNWMSGECNGRMGVFPVNYVEIIQPLTTERPSCVALYDFESNHSDKDRDCIQFAKNDRIIVIRKVDDNWAEGILKDKIGIFPLSFVKLNDEAKKLIDEMSSDAGDDRSHRGVMGAAARRITSNKQGGKNAKKRHSFPTFHSEKNKDDKPGTSAHRHSMDVDVGALSISNGNTSSSASVPPDDIDVPVQPVAMTTKQSTTTTKLQELVKMRQKRDSSPNNASPNMQAPSNSSTSTNGAQVQLNKPSGSKSSDKPQLSQRPSSSNITTSKLISPAKVVKATYSYQAQKSDELGLVKGETYRITEVCNDGWCRGTHMQTGKSGAFPGNYITPTPVLPSVTKASPVSTRPKIDFSSRSASTPADGRLLGRTYEQYRQLIKQQQSNPETSRPKPAVANKVVSVGKTPKSSSMQSSKPSSSNVLSPRNSAPSADSSSNTNPTKLTLTTVKSTSPTPTSSMTSSSKSSNSPPITKVNPVSSNKPSKSPPPPRPVAPVAKLQSVRQNSMEGRPTSTSNDPSTSSSRPVSSNMSAFQPASQNKVLKKPTDREKKRDRSHVLLKMITGGGRKLRTSTPRTPTPTSPPPTPSGHPLSDNQHTSTSHHNKPSVKPLPRDRYYATMNYPANGPEELDLHEGDVIVVHSRRPDGWFKGTHQQSGKTGHFPSTFVERIA